MNVLTIIGNAVCDEKFRAQFFDDPIGTAQRYGFQLTVMEAEILQKLADSRDKIQEDLCNLEESVRVALNCPQRPCGFAVQAPADPNPPKEMAAD